mmetsp:Transcript_38495/g.43719  ORF Transcript_38495/g.43719 Transcript_38495/m.43719 type:complete len:282 (+) Transcript_38495:203-1048(+)
METCHGCLQPYNSRLRQLVVYRCHHHGCAACIQRHTQSQSVLTTTCPLCNVPVIYMQTPSSMSSSDPSSSQELTMDSQLLELVQGTPLAYSGADVDGQIAHSGSEYFDRESLGNRSELCSQMAYSGSECFDRESFGNRSELYSALELNQDCSLWEGSQWSHSSHTGRSQASFKHSNSSGDVSVTSRNEGSSAFHKRFHHTEEDKSWTPSPFLRRSQSDSPYIAAGESSLGSSSRVSPNFGGNRKRPRNSQALVSSNTGKNETASSLSFESLFQGVHHLRSS